MISLNKVITLILLRLALPYLTMVLDPPLPYYSTQTMHLLLNVLIERITQSSACSTSTDYIGQITDLSNEPLTALLEPLIVVLEALSKMEKH